MAENMIAEYLKKIMGAVYGKDVRQSIHDAIQQCYTDASAGITPIITTKELTTGTRVTVTVGAESTSFVVYNGTATTEEVKAYVNEYLDTHPDMTTTVADGSVSVEKTDMFDITKANVTDMEVVTTDSNYLAIRNAKANTKYYILKSLDTTNWSVGAFVPNIVYSLNEATNAKTNVGSCTTETVDGVDYHVFTPTADYDLLGFYRADGILNPFESYVNYAYYGTEAPFVTEDVYNGMNPDWKNPLMEFIKEDIQNTVDETIEGNWSGEKTDRIVTPEKTSFMQMMNIGSGNYNMGNPFLNKVTYEPNDSPNATLADYYGKLLDVNYSAFGKLLNNGEYAIIGHMLMIPLSEGEYWVRLLSTTRTRDVNFAIFDHPDIIAEPTQYELLNYDLMYNTANWTDYEGNAHSGEITLGEWEYIDGSGSTCTECFVGVYKVTVPKGKYAFLLFPGTYSSVGSCPGISTNYDMNSLYTIFDYDPIDNILEIVNSDYDAKSLTIAESMMKGFVKTLFKEKSVMKFFVDNASDIFPEKYNKHTFGKSYVAFGDSLTQYSGGDGKSGVGFLSQINKYLGMEMTQTGYAGSNWTGTGVGDAPTRIQALIDAGVSYDVITLAWGTNSDATAGNGTIDDAPSKTGTMVAVMKWAINSIRETYPFTGLGIIIPPDGASAMSGGSKADLMIEVCKLMRVPYLDLYYSSNIIANNNVSGGLGNDQVHLYTYGRNRYASALGQFIEKICPYANHYKVTYNLTNVTSSRTNVWWSEGDSFATTLTASTGTISSVEVTMDGEDITASVYVDGEINIDGVTGDVVITAIAE